MASVARDPAASAGARSRHANARPRERPDRAGAGGHFRTRPYSPRTLRSTPVGAASAVGYPEAGPDDLSHLSVLCRPLCASVWKHDGPVSAGPTKGHKNETPDRRWQRVWVERGIYLQPNGKYAVRVVIDGRARLRTAATTLEGAREQRLLLAEAARRGELPVFPRLTFGEARRAGCSCSRRRSPWASVASGRSRTTATTSKSICCRRSAGGICSRSRRTTSLT